MKWIETKKAEIKPVVGEDVLGFYLNGEMHVVYYWGNGEWARRLDKEYWNVPDYWARLPQEPIQPERGREE